MQNTLDIPNLQFATSNPLTLNQQIWLDLVKNPPQKKKLLRPREIMQIRDNVEDWNTPNQIMITKEERSKMKIQDFNLDKPLTLMDSNIGPVLVKAVVPTIVDVNVGPTGVGLAGTVDEPARSGVNTVAPAGIVVNTVGVLGFKQPVLVKLTNLSKACTSVNLDFGTIETYIQSSSTFQHENDLYTLAICAPNNYSDKARLKSHNPIILNRNTNVNVNGQRLNETKIETYLQEPVLVNLTLMDKFCSMSSNKPCIVPVQLSAADTQKYFKKLPRKTEIIFIFNPDSLPIKFSNVMNHIFIAKKVSSCMQARMVLYSTETAFSKGDFIGQAVLFNSSNPNHVQRCLESSKLQAGL